jgi:hypothetical protein
MGPLFFLRRTKKENEEEGFFTSARLIEAGRIRYKILQTKWARNPNRRSMNTPPTQIRKLSVILGELICFLSMGSKVTTHCPPEHQVRRVDCNGFSESRPLRYTSSIYD